jgi:phosphatidylinositol alpha-1,6-mannosyltransferase
MRQRGAEAADLILCVSRYTRGKVAGWARVAPERIVVLSNTFREIFTPGSGDELRKAWALDGKKVILTVGRISAAERYKGHDRVISALPALATTGHDVAYVIIGSGDDTERLKRLADLHGVTEQVHFIGEVDTLTLVEAYRMADLFVMPSNCEGFGIVFLEAMASGTPALGLAIAGALDPLADGELGHAVAEADLDAELGRALSSQRPDSELLAGEVRRRFGREAFIAGAAAVMRRLMEAA